MPPHSKPIPSTPRPPILHRLRPLRTTLPGSVNFRPLDTDRPARKHRGSILQGWIPCTSKATGRCTNNIHTRPTGRASRCMIHVSPDAGEVGRLNAKWRKQILIDEALIRPPWSFR